jgi:phosphotransferase system HPr (HPr) family protein
VNLPPNARERRVNGRRVHALFLRLSPSSTTTGGTLRIVRTRELTVTNPSGLHARPASIFSAAAAGFASRVTVENLTRGKGPVDASSTLLLLTAGVSAGHRIRLVTDGDDEQAALDGLVSVMESGLGEATPD